MRPIGTEADHPDFGDVGMVDRGEPPQLGHGSRVLRAEPDLNLMVTPRDHLATFAGEAIPSKTQGVMLGWETVGVLEDEDRTLRAKAFQRGEVGLQSTDAR
jgi:hypothetical protein